MIARDEVLAVGGNSFLAQAFRAAAPGVRVAHHGDIDRPDLLDGVRCIVSFAKHPGIAADGYDLAGDPDLRLAARIGDRDVAFIMLSSRKVYAPGPAPLHEDSPLGPSDAYGRNKLAVEQALTKQLGARLTRLRVANAFGFERTPGRRSFLGILLAGLAEAGRVRLDMSPFVARDFIPDGAFARVLARVVEDPPGGALNLGSGIALPTGRLALWVIEGYGRGELVVTSPREHDAFVLDITRLRARYGDPCTEADLRSACHAIGRRLRA